MGRRRARSGGQSHRRAPAPDGLRAGLFAQLRPTEHPCASPGCTQTFLLAPRARLTGARPDDGLCPRHRAEALGLAPRPIPCAVPGCTRSWTWSALDQLGAAEPDGVDPGATPELPPPPLRPCAPCQSKQRRLRPRPVTCRVHTCTGSATVSVRDQLRAWAALGTLDLDREPPMPKRMCPACREFCRRHPDRQVPCIRTGCDGTWTFKSGAQLHAMRAGALQDPARPCPTCEAREREAGSIAGDGSAETMPCVVPRCAGTWTWRPGAPLRQASEGALPPDRMCARCRSTPTGAHTSQTS